MSNIDKQGRQVQRYANFGVDMMEWADGGYVKHSDYLALLDELDELEALQSFRTAFNEWHDKTEWVQGDNRFDVIKPWGKHRADVLKLYIEHLEEKLKTADKLQDSAFRHGLQHGFSLGQTDNQAGFEECLSAYGSRGKDNG